MSTTETENRPVKTLKLTQKKVEKKVVEGNTFIKENIVRQTKLRSITKELGMQKKLSTQQKLSMIESQPRETESASEIYSVRSIDNNSGVS